MILKLLYSLLGCQAPLLKFFFSVGVDGFRQLDPLFLDLVDSVDLPEQGRIDPVVAKVAVEEEATLL